MDEISYKLKSGNSLLIVSAVDKLLTLIRSDKKPESDALQLLRDSCCSSDSAVALASCQGLLSLATNGVLSPLHTLSSMMAMLPSAKNYTSIVSTIAGILTLELRSLETDYQCHFGLRSPQHPLIKVLETCPEAHEDVLAQMHALCSHSFSIISDNALELLRPVFLWLLCHPTEDHSESKQEACWRILLECDPKLQTSLFKECLLWQQVSRPRQLQATLSTYSSLLEHALRHRNTKCVQALMPVFASISNRFIELGRDPRPCYGCIERCLDESVGPYTGVTLRLLAENALKTPALYLHSLFDLCVKISSKNAIPSIALSTLIAYSLQWLYIPSVLTSDALPIIIEILELQHTARTSIDLNDTKNNELYTEFLHTDRRMFVAHEQLKTWEAIKHNHEDVDNWLDGIGKSHSESKTDFVAFLLGLILENTSESAVLKALKITSDVVNTNIHQAVLVLPILVYTLKNSSSKVQLECLKAIPQMARFKPNVPAVVSILNKLKTQHGAPTSLLLRLYTDLVAVQPRCYPALHEMLIGDKLMKGDLKWEVDIARAEAVRNICETRASASGAELVAVLSSILNKCGDQAGTAACRLALDGVRSLWADHVISPPSTWRALANKLTRDRRPAVHVSLCELLSEVPSLRVQTPDYDALMSEAARVLWCYVADSDEPRVVIAACNALEHFRIEDYTLKDIPEIYRQGIQLPASYCKTPVDAARKPEDVLDYIPCEVWPNVFKNTIQSGLTGVQALVRALIEREVKGYRSGVYQRDGKAEPDKLSYLPPHSVTRGIMEFVRRQALSPAYDCPDGVLLVALGCLTHAFPKPLPPLDMCFVHELFHRGEHLRWPSLLLAARQALVSPSAKRFVENYLQSAEPDDGKEEEIMNLFDMLRALCRTIPPATLRPVLQKYMQFAYSSMPSDTSQDNMQNVLFVQQLDRISDALADDIHDANRTLLSQIVEGYWDVVPDSCIAWPAYERCVCALSTKHLERMTSPSSWWETTGPTLRRAARVRCRLARDDLVWLNDIVGAAVSCLSEHNFVLGCIAAPLASAAPDVTSRDWLLQLMARVQIAIAESPADVTGLAFLCDVFALSLVLMSGARHLDVRRHLELDTDVSREALCQSLPAAVSALYDRDDWLESSVQMIEWLQHTRRVEALPLVQRRSLGRCLRVLRHAPYFAERAVWTRVLSERMV